MLYVGIDPGLSGGVAFIDERHPRTASIRAFRMPKTDVELLRIFQDIVERAAFDDDPIFAMLEHVHSTPQMGVASSFTFGLGYGKILMALAATGIPYELVSPIKWQNVMGCRTPKEVRAELGHKDKNINKRAAEAMLARKNFPMMTVTHAIADALLLAEYCRRERGGRLFDDSAVETDSGKKGKARATRQGSTAPTPTAAARRRRTRT